MTEGSRTARLATDLERFCPKFCNWLNQPHTVNPRTITVDKNPAYPKAIVEMKQAAGCVPEGGRKIAIGA